MLQHGASAGGAGEKLISRTYGVLLVFALLAAPILFTSGKIKAAYDLPVAITMLAGLFVIGLLVLSFLPETKGKDLPA